MRARTVEHLYQALRFPDDPELQQAIFATPSPLFAKRLAYRHLDTTRPDWEEVKSDVMAWCLELKYIQHPLTFGNLLLATGNRNIVEASPRDDYWGAKPIANGDKPPMILRGWNVLGRLLRMTRRKIEVGSSFDLRAAVIEIPNFRLVGDDAIALAISSHLI
jgi:ribA/ribD-fused uncharacterized protein